MTIMRTRAPAWFGVVAVVLVLWGLLGCYACFEQLRPGGSAMGAATPYDCALIASLPGWYNLCYVVAVLAGTAGAVALVVRWPGAVPLAVLALAAPVVMFGYIFLATDLIAHKGAAATVPFPVFIVAVALAQLWLARHAVARGWIG